MKQERIDKIFKVLRKKYGSRPKNYSPFRVLVHVMIASRTTDLVSWPATDRMMSKGKNPYSISKMKIRDIEKIIFPANFYKTKARHIKLACKMLVENFGGKVPRTREDLMRLPGVGGKSADIVLSFSYGKHVIAVDAHVKWVSNSLNLSRENDPEKIREDLHGIFQGKKRLLVNDLMVQFGREICNTGRPKCWMCPISKLCPYGKKRLRPPT